MWILLCFLPPPLLFHISFYVFMKCEHAIGERWRIAIETKPMPERWKWQSATGKAKRLLCCFICCFPFRCCVSRALDNVAMKTQELRPQKKRIKRNFVCRFSFYFSNISFRLRICLRVLLQIDNIVWTFDCHKNLWTLTACMASELCIVQSHSSIFIANICIPY